MNEAQARATGTRHSSAPEATELPTGKAFVIQLTRDSDPGRETFAGRVEHVATGRRLRFADLAAFQAAVARLLAEAPQT
jgi:hypothetical protein